VALPVYFESVEAAEAVIRNRRENRYGGNWIDCKPSVAEDLKGGKGKKGGKDAGAADENTPVSEKLFVNNLPKEATEDAVMFHFCQYGNVKEASLKKDQSGASRGFAFVTFESLEEAQLVLDSPEAAEFEGKTLDIKPAVEKEGKGGKDGKGKGKGKDGKGAILVECIPLHATEDSVRQYFGHFGPVAGVVLEYDEMGLSRGTAHVSFESAESTRAVLSHYGDNGGQFTPLEWEGGILLDITASEVPKRGSDAPVSEKIFVGSLARHLKQEDVEKFYCQFGDIKEVFMKCEPDGSFRGHCFVTFRDMESARRALDANGSANMLGACRPFASSTHTPAGQDSSSQPPPTSNVVKIDGLPVDPKARDVFRFFYSYSVTRIRDTGDTIFVEFNNDEECKKAFKEKLGQRLGAHYVTLAGATQEELAQAALTMKSTQENKGAKGGYSPY